MRKEQRFPTNFLLYETFSCISAYKREKLNVFIEFNSRYILQLPRIFFFKKEKKFKFLFLCHMI